jgi:hypothetical protein
LFDNSELKEYKRSGAKYKKSLQKIAGCSLINTCVVIYLTYIAPKE